MTVRWRVFCLLIGLCGWATPAAAGTPIEETVGIFERMVRLERAYDPALAELYTDDAKIEYLRHYPDGSTREIKMTGAELKSILRKMGPLAKALKSNTRYEDVRYRIEGRNLMRIEGKRVSVSKKQANPFHMIVGITQDGTWKILSEYGEARP